MLVDKTESEVPKVILDYILRNNWLYEGARESDLVFKVSLPRSLMDERELYSSGAAFIFVRLAPYLKSVVGPDAAPVAYSITISINKEAPLRFERFLFLPADASASKRIGYLFCRAEEAALAILRFFKGGR